LTDNSFESDEQTYQSNVRTALAFIRTIDAQKRTHLAELRTGIGILTIPMSLLTILIATSNYYSITEVISFISALVLGIVILSIIGGYLVYTAIKDIRTDEYLRSSYDFASLVVDFNNHNQE
jgi:uncharacterized membrane protein YidH (DUF202 family)